MKNKREKIYEKDIDNWEFKFQNIKNISELENLRCGDYVYLFNQKCPIREDRNYFNCSVFLLDNNNRIKDIKYKIHRLIYEYGHKCILSKDEHIHHKDHNRLNNRLNNLEKMSIYEHMTLHNTDLRKRIMNLKTGEIYESTLDASEKTGISSSHMSACCNYKFDSYLSNLFIYLDEYDSDKTKRKIENLKNYIGFDEEKILYTKYDSLSEESFKDWNFRYNNVDITTFYNIKKNQKIWFCGKYNLVKEDRCCKNNLVINLKFPTFEKKIHLKNIIYLYFNRDKNEIDYNDEFIDNIDGDVTNINIDNLKLVYTRIPEQYFNDFIFEEECSFGISDLYTENEYFPEYCEFK